MFNTITIFQKEIVNLFNKNNIYDIYLTKTLMGIEIGLAQKRCKQSCLF